MEEFKHPNDEIVAHKCHNGIRGYPSVLCSSHRETLSEKEYKEMNLSISDLVEMANELQGKLYYKFGYKNPERNTDIIIFFANKWQIGVFIEDNCYVGEYCFPAKDKFWKPLPPKPTLV